MAKPLLVIVGADKGGVGKTTTCRALLDYYKTKGVAYRAFDSEPEPGVLKRFYPEATIVDLAESDGQMKVLDNLNAAPVNVLDLKAGILKQALKDLGEIGFLDMVRDGKIDIVVLHVIGNTVESFGEIKATATMLAGAKHYLVKNHINKGAFFGWNNEIAQQAVGTGDGMIDIPQLDPLAAEQVGAASRPFSAFGQDPDKSLVLKGWLGSWLKKVYAQFDSIKALLPQQ